MEAAFHRTADSLRLHPPHIPHTIAIMMTALTLHNEDPYGVGDALNIFLFRDFSPSSGHRWELPGNYRDFIVVMLFI